jgi:hypothetical protein
MRYMCLLLVLSTLSQARAQDVAAERWGRDDCLYVSQGTNWTPSDVCRQQITPIVWDIFSRNDPSRAISMRLTVFADWLEVEQSADVVFVVPNHGSILHLFDDKVNTYALGPRGNFPVISTAPGTPKLPPPLQLFARIEQLHWPSHDPPPSNGIPADSPLNGAIFRDQQMRDMRKAQQRADNARSP